MISRNAINDFMGSLYSSLSVEFGRSGKKREESKIIKKFRLNELEDKINEYRASFKEIECNEKTKNQQNTFICALDDLYGIVLQELKLQIKDARSKNSNLTLDDILKDQNYCYKLNVIPSYCIAQETLLLLEKLKLDNSCVEENYKNIKKYVNNCQQQFPKESHTNNFLKAVATVAITALDFVLGAALSATVGLVASPVLCIYLGVLCAKFSNDKPTTKVVGALTGLLFSPVGYVLGVVASPFILASMGKESGKEWFGIPKYTSISRCLFFKPSLISSTVNKVANNAEKLFTQSENKKTHK